MDIGAFEAGAIAGAGIALVITWKVMDFFFLKKLNGKKNDKKNNSTCSTTSMSLMANEIHDTKRIAIALKEQGIADTINIENCFNNMSRAQEETNTHLEEMIKVLKEKGRR